MEKKIPKVFANTIDKELQNNSRFHYSKGDYVRNEKRNNLISIEQKINEIFNSSRYVYKADVLITYKDGKVERKTIVGRNRNELITFDNKVIKNNDIIDIDFA